jgi:hypothetical protein
MVTKGEAVKGDLYLFTYIRTVQDSDEDAEHYASLEGCLVTYISALENPCALPMLIRTSSGHEFYCSEKELYHPEKHTKKQAKKQTSRLEYRLGI